MAARAQMKPDFDGPEDRQLADDIARVMQYRPLLSRLSHTETENEAEMPPAEAPLAHDFAGNAPPEAVSPPAPDPRSLEEIIDDLSAPVTPPASAAWLEKARQEQRQNRKQHAMAWVKTWAIALAIVVPALLFLRG